MLFLSNNVFWLQKAWNEKGFTEKTTWSGCFFDNFWVHFWIPRWAHENSFIKVIVNSAPTFTNVFDYNFVGEEIREYWKQLYLNGK